jgi:hypothetical protein
VTEHVLADICDLVERTEGRGTVSLLKNILQAKRINKHAR